MLQDNVLVYQEMHWAKDFFGGARIEPDQETLILSWSWIWTKSYAEIMVPLSQVQRSGVFLDNIIMMGMVVESVVAAARYGKRLGL